MADIELVIKVPEEIYEAIMADNYKNQPQKAENDLLVLLNSLDTATPLPKGHGDLIDRNKLNIPPEEMVARMAVQCAPTVIGEDEEVEE